MLHELSYVAFVRDVNLGDAAVREGLPRIETRTYISVARDAIAVGEGKEHLRLYLDTEMRVIHVHVPGAKCELVDVPLEQVERVNYINPSAMLKSLGLGKAKARAVEVSV